MINGIVFVKIADKLLSKNFYSHNITIYVNFEMPKFQISIVPFIPFYFIILYNRHIATSFHILVQYISYIVFF